MLKKFFILSLILEIICAKNLNDTNTISNNRSIIVPLKIVRSYFVPGDQQIDWDYFEIEIGIKNQGVFYL